MSSRAKWGHVVVSFAIVISVVAPPALRPYAYSDWRPAHQGFLALQSPSHVVESLEIEVPDPDENRSRVVNVVGPDGNPVALNMVGGDLPETKYYRVRTKLWRWFPGPDTRDLEVVNKNEWDRLARGATRP